MVKTPTEIRALLTQLGARPEKSFGQNFLIDPTVLASVVEAGELAPGEAVLEVGPGLGVLTEDLLATGAHVHAIERDRKFITYLEAAFANDAKRFLLTQGDAAEIDWNTLLSADQPWKFISNLPYAISSLALRYALWGEHPASHVVVMLQRELAERALVLVQAKQVKERSSLLALMVALSCSSGKIVRRVAPGSFFPAPNVESAILLLQPMTQAERLKRWGIHPGRVMEIAKRGFKQPRKQLFSNLEVRDRREELAQALDLSPDVRPEALSTEHWVALTKLLDQT